MHPLELILNIFAIYMQVFAIMDPFGIVPIYIGLTEGLDHIDRRRVVNHIAIVCTALILIFTVSGKWILDFFGISIPAVRIGGGILLLAIAIDMLGGLPKAKQVESEELATVPLATPLLVGPGTITTLILLVTKYSILEVLSGSLLVVLTTYLILYYADRVLGYLGRGFIRTLARIMAVIVASIAVEMIHSAMVEWYLDLIR
ncbi:MarC family protein [Candidatus Geothermarchaeota archaeon]|nr:MAG: MarC family protein [Candidatus Geothermarchaeota archaeon]HEW93538.1 MarC family protein [Thermoprotei archaeon]